jgi:hypothetical protein
LIAWRWCIFLGGAGILVGLGGANVVDVVESDRRREVRVRLRIGRIVARDILLCICCCWGIEGICMIDQRSVIEWGII